MPPANGAGCAGACLKHGLIAQIEFLRLRNLPGLVACVFFLIVARVVL